MLLALRAGARLEEHRAAGPVSVQTLMGHVRLHTAGTNVDLPVGRLVSLERDVPHMVEALEESAFLLTIAWPDGRAAPPGLTEGTDRAGNTANRAAVAPRLRSCGEAVPGCGC